MIKTVFACSLGPQIEKQAGYTVHENNGSFSMVSLMNLDVTRHIYIITTQFLTGTSLITMNNLVHKLKMLNQ